MSKEIGEYFNLHFSLHYICTCAHVLWSFKLTSQVFNRVKILEAKMAMEALILAPYNHFSDEFGTKKLV